MQDYSPLICITSKMVFEQRWSSVSPLTLALSPISANLRTLVSYRNLKTLVAMVSGTGFEEGAEFILLRVRSASKYISLYSILSLAI
jgi:hypothetical protein